MDHATFKKDASFYLRLPLDEEDVHWETINDDSVNFWQNFNIGSRGERPFNYETGYFEDSPLSNTPSIITGINAPDRPVGRIGVDSYGWEGLAFWHEVLTAFKTTMVDKFWAKQKRHKNRGFYEDSMSPMAGWWISKKKYFKTSNLSEITTQVPGIFTPDMIYTIDLIYIPTEFESSNPMVLRLGYRNALASVTNPVRILRYPAYKNDVIRFAIPMLSGGHITYYSYYHRQSAYGQWKLRQELKASIRKLKRLKKQAKEEGVSWLIPFYEEQIKKLTWTPTALRKYSDLNISPDDKDYKKYFSTHKGRILRYYEAFISVDFIELDDNWEDTLSTVLSINTSGEPQKWEQYAKSKAQSGHLIYLGPSLKNKKVEEQKKDKSKYKKHMPVWLIPIINYPIRKPKVIRNEK